MVGDCDVLLLLGAGKGRTALPILAMVFCRCRAPGFYGPYRTQEKEKKWKVEGRRKEDSL
jgi:hypothetical protein